MSGARPPSGEPRILFVLPSLGAGGAETQTVQLINNVLAGRSSKYLACFDPGQDLARRVDGAAVTVVRLRRRWKLDISIARQLAELIDREMIDVVHCSLLIAVFWGWFGAALSSRRPPVIAAIHTTLNADKRADVFDVILYQWILRLCSRIIFVCEAQRKHWEARFPPLSRRSTVIYNGVDTDGFDPALVAHEAAELRQQLSLGGSRVIAHVAAFRPEKGHDLLLEAFHRLCRRRNDLVLVFAGDGPLRSAMQAKATSLGIAHKVRFLGVLQDVRPLLAVAQCAVNPSRAESFSMAILEALAMQVPVVATDVGGTREVVENGNSGILVRSGDPDALAEGLERCLEDENRRRAMGIAGRLRVEAAFGQERMFIKTGALIAEVAGTSVSGRHG